MEVSGRCEYHGGNTVKGVGRWRIEGGGSERIKRKVYEARDVSAAEAACLPQPLLALRPPRSGVSSAGLKTGILLPFVRRMPFPSFIYLCLSAVGKRALSPALFPPPVLRSIIPLQDSLRWSRQTDMRFEILDSNLASRHRKDMRRPLTSQFLISAHSKFPVRTSRVAYKILFIT